MADQQPVSTSLASGPFFLVHSDTAGPISTQSIHGDKYSTVFVDDYSRVYVGLFSL